MSTKADLLAAHKAMVAVLDAKFAKNQEWQAFRAIDKALLAHIEQNAAAVPATVAESPRDGRSARARKNSRNGEPSYPDLAVRALTTNNRPMPTGELIGYIRQYRSLPKTDERRTRVNISSSFSHDERLENILYNGERTWWLAGRDVPQTSNGLRFGEFEIPQGSLNP